jgi:hypothetical protein
MFQLFSYFVKIDVTLGVVTVSTHGLKIIRIGLI